eukprot:10725599-Ditylum_brightwellii.AAC.1
MRQNTLKDCMAAHYQSIKKLFSNAETSSTFARHFGNRSHWPNLAPGESPSPNNYANRSEIYRTCMHKPDFHRFGTGEAIEAKKVVLDLSAENQ